MSRPQQLDVLFQSLLGRFFSIPARQPSVGTVTFAQMRVLWMLDFHGPGGLSALSRRLGISNPATTELVDRLVEGGYVRRLPSKSDRRCIVLSLNPQARAVLRELAVQRRERFQKLMGVMSRSDISRMTSALQTLNRLIGRWEEVSE